MLSSLKFVQGAVSTKHFIPELKHFTIVDGVATGFNGTLALSSPVDLSVDCAPKAAQLVKAIEQCSDTVSLQLTKANRLRVLSGPFKVFVDCVELEGLPEQRPEGDDVPIDGEALMEALPKLLPFVGSDASRPWSNGVLLKGGSAFATNNVCLIEYWLGAGAQVPEPLNIPLAALKEMMRIGEAPVSVQASANSVTFHYEGHRWLRTQLYSTAWPNLTKVLERPSANLQPTPPNFFDGLALLKPFLEQDGLVHIKNGVLYTSQDEELGASYAAPEIESDGVYVYRMLSLLEPVAEKIDFDAYPDPLAFQGHRIRGVVLGRRP